ncbi:protein of unknown function [Methylococcus capsulatus]|uniref:Uncharacterized protein n=1 Tax=Methylococcus capsulatus TaxID=414 RepID=A0AA35UJN3_METCP|nr:protein of unknown function [Methylococcus capsulatus]
MERSSESRNMLLENDIIDNSKIPQHWRHGMIGRSSPPWRFAPFGQLGYHANLNIKTLPLQNPLR